MSLENLDSTGVDGVFERDKAAVVAGNSRAGSSLVINEPWEGSAGDYVYEQPGPTRRDRRSASERFSDVGKQRNVFGLTVVEHRSQLSHSALGPVGMKATENLVLEMEPLRTVAYILPCLAGDLTLAVPVQHVVQATYAFKSDLPTFIEGEVISAIITDEDVQTVIGQQSDG
ncbi:hypothetical protein [Mycolicibacterium palauense]|uniref:hypothetical protein n=1 Tax=Mycolicibacterium palauense TaxID=2034511 RepID=UPI00159BD464|nr:hypothetical protein [Mycolicibacterium palauense]